PAWAVPSAAATMARASNGRRAWDRRLIRVRDMAGMRIEVTQSDPCRAVIVPTCDAGAGHRQVSVVRRDFVLRIGLGSDGCAGTHLLVQRAKLRLQQID